MQKAILVLVGVHSIRWIELSVLCKTRTWGPFLESPGNLLGPISIFLNFTYRAW